MHISVLLNEAIEGLNIKENGIYVDCTLGLGGHSQEILKHLKKGHLYCFEQDQEAIDLASLKLAKYSNFTIIKSNFVNLKAELNKRSIEKIDGILYDLGVSSLQFDQANRGFSYRFDNDLDMRMDKSNELTAKDIVNDYSFHELMRIFKVYGEEKFAKEIARNIEKKRSIKPIDTTFELIDIIKEVLPKKVIFDSKHPAKKVFQSLRIAVNDELNVFEKSLRDAFDLMNRDGRIVVISFHSLEDRICKELFREKTQIDLPKNLPIRNLPDLDFEVITKKPLVPSDEELEKNNRSHSAKMRILRRK